MVEQAYWLTVSSTSSTTNDIRSRTNLRGDLTSAVVWKIILFLIFQNLDRINIVNAEDEYQEDGGIFGVDVVQASIPQWTIVVIVIHGENQPIENEEEQQLCGHWNTHFRDVSKEFTAEIRDMTQMMLTCTSVSSNVTQKIIDKMINN